MWQKLQDDLGNKGFTILAVATDTAAAARPWIEGAKPSYPALIDEGHHVGALYNLVNVPQAVWIDEQGTIVRPPENAGWSDAFRKRNRQTRELAPELQADYDRIKRAYLDAVRDWAAKGEKCEHILTAAAARAKLRPHDDTTALACAHFQLAQALVRQGRQDEAATHFAEASRLHPESWSLWRQAAKRDPASGFASGPEFWARVDALGDKAYYPLPEIKGVAEPS